MGVLPARLGKAGGIVALLLTAAGCTRASPHPDASALLGASTHDSSTPKPTSVGTPRNSRGLAAPRSKEGYAEVGQLSLSAPDADKFLGQIDSVGLGISYHNLWWTFYETVPVQIGF